MTEVNYGAGTQSDVRAQIREGLLRTVKDLSRNGKEPVKPMDAISCYSLSPDFERLGKVNHEMTGCYFSWALSDLIEKGALISDEKGLRPASN